MISEEYIPDPSFNLDAWIGKWEGWPPNPRAPVPPLPADKWAATQDMTAAQSWAVYSQHYDYYSTLILQKYEAAKIP